MCLSLGKYIPKHVVFHIFGHGVECYDMTICVRFYVKAMDVLVDFH